MHAEGDGAPLATYREHTVEIFLGPKGAFENGNIGALTLRGATDRIVRSVRSRREKPLREPKTPRVTELLRKAMEWRRQLDAGEVRNQADIARREGITRARVTQVMGMLGLPPQIREQILSMPDSLRRPQFSERMLRPFKSIADPGLTTKSSVS